MNFSETVVDFEADMRTISSVLTIDEKSRQYLWSISIQYTLLINKIFQEISESSQLQEWLNRGRLPKEVVKVICDKLKESEFVGLPARVYTSATSLVAHTFKSWFALQKDCKSKIEGKRRWLRVMETDLELAQDATVTIKLIRIRAAEILVEIETQQGSNDDQKPRQGKTKKYKAKTSNALMSLLFERWDSAVNLLDRRAIAHLLRNNCRVNQEEEDPDEHDLRLEKKRIEIQRLEERLKSRLPTGRDPLGERSQKFLEEAIAFAEHDAFLPMPFWLRWHRTILNSPAVDPEHLNHWFIGLAYYYWNSSVEFEAWEQDIPRRTANLQISLSALPYPLLFESATDLYWFWETHTPPVTSSKFAYPNKSEPPDTVQRQQRPKRCRVRKRQKQSARRIYLRFSGKGP